MLILSRHKGESLMIGDNIRVEVASIVGDRVKLAFTAPENVRIHRQEVYDKIQKEPKWGRCAECGDATHLNDSYLCSTCEEFGKQRLTDEGPSG